MEVLINNCPIEFELEGEKTLSDIVNSINVWSAERGLVFSQVVVDESPYHIGEVPDVDLSGVGNINCIVQSRADLILGTIDEGIRYCDKIIHFIDDTGEKAEQEAVKDIAGGIQWMADVLVMVAQQIGRDPGDVKCRDEVLSVLAGKLQDLHKSLLAAKPSAFPLLASKRDLVSQSKEFFGVLLMSREMKDLVLKSVDSPDMLAAQIEAIRQSLSVELENLEQSAAAFQAGKDREGSERLNRFIDFVYRYSRACYQVSPLFGVELSSVEVNGTTLEDKNGKLREFLDETTSIMENNDIISLADMLEYEIKPFMEDIGEYMEALIVRIGGAGRS